MCLITTTTKKHKQTKNRAIALIESKKSINFLSQNCYIYIHNEMDKSITGIMINVMHCVLRYICTT